MVRPGAQLPVMSVTAEVVTLAKLAAHHLVRVIPRQTLALAADTVTSIVTQGLQ